MKESCGGHFREEYQTPDGEALRNDDEFSYVAAWQYQSPSAADSVLHKEALDYEFIKRSQRSYK
jgi:succinate dehydrogenase / fumarate reductase flavoprotein subunit